MSVAPAGFHLRAPPPAHERGTFITQDALLFETIHMGPANVDVERWRLQVDGLVDRPFSLDLAQLRALPARTVAAFHECWGSPLRPQTSNLLRVGNVEWTGVPLGLLVDHAQPRTDARFVWSEGLDSGEFGGKRMDCYRKDLPLAKALADDVLVAYAMNGEPLRKERGGPVRLVVPGWFGTNMTKWLCRLSIQAERAPGPFTNDWYNEDVQVGEHIVRRPVWEAAPNAMIVEPAEGARLSSCRVQVRGWAWGASPISHVDLSVDGGRSWRQAPVAPRQQQEWQGFELEVEIDGGGDGVTILARATDAKGDSQPLQGARNMCHAVSCTTSRHPRGGGDPELP